MRKILRDNHGESIVEVLVSFLMLLIIVGAFTTAIRGANAMMTRANEIRKEAFDLELNLQGKLYPVDGSAPTVDEVDNKHYVFIREGKDEARFEIPADLGHIEAEAGETTHLFPQYPQAEDTP